MENDGGQFVVRVWPSQLRSLERMRYAAPSRSTVLRLANALSRPVRSNADAQEHIRIALSLLHYWPSSFPPVVAELQRRRRIALRRDRLARRRQRRQRQEDAAEAEIDEELWAMLQTSDEELPMAVADVDDLPEPQGPPVALSP